MTTTNTGCAFVSLQPAVFGFTFAVTRLPSMTIDSASMLFDFTRLTKSLHLTSFCPPKGELKAMMRSAKMNAASTQPKTCRPPRLGGSCGWFGPPGWLPPLLPPGRLPPSESDIATRIRSREAGAVELDGRGVWCIRWTLCRSGPAILDTCPWTTDKSIVGNRNMRA